MDDVIKQDSHHVPAARAYLSQVWLRKRRQWNRKADLNLLAKARPADLPSEARDVYREVFRLYSKQGMCPFPVGHQYQTRLCTT